MGRQRRRKFSPEFKAEAVRLVTTTDESLSTIARELGVTTTSLRHWTAAARSLRKWVEAARPQPRVPLTEDERTELTRLRRELRRVEMERDILKKATAFFARQSE